MTELHISPKTRRGPVPSTSEQSEPRSFEYATENRPAHTVQTEDNRQAELIQSQYDTLESDSGSNTQNSNMGSQENMDIFHRLLSSVQRLVFGSSRSLSQTPSKNSLSLGYQYKQEMLPRDCKILYSLRVQPQTAFSDRTSPRQDVISACQSPSDASFPKIKPVEITSQPTCVYISHHTAKTLLRNTETANTNLDDMSRTFFGILSRSRTPGEREEALKKSMLRARSKGNSAVRAETGSRDQGADLPEDSREDQDNAVVVRVVILDEDNSFSLKGPNGAEITSIQMKPEYGVLESHVMVGNLLRRQMALQATGRVTLGSLTDSPPVKISVITLQPLFDVVS